MLSLHIPMHDFASALAVHSCSALLQCTFFSAKEKCLLSKILKLFPKRIEKFLSTMVKFCELLPSNVKVH